MIITRSEILTFGFKFFYLVTSEYSSFWQMPLKLRDEHDTQNGKALYKNTSDSSVGLSLNVWPILATQPPR